MQDFKIVKRAGDSLMPNYTVVMSRIVEDGQRQYMVSTSDGYAFNENELFASFKEALAYFKHEKNIWCL